MNIKRTKGMFDDKLTGQQQQKKGNEILEENRRTHIESQQLMQNQSAKKEIRKEYKTRNECFGKFSIIMKETAILPD